MTNLSQIFLGRISSRCLLASLTITFLLLNVAILKAQRRSYSKDTETGKIVGTVIDAQTGKSVIGANVLLVGFSNGDATDLNGDYTISNLEPGIYSVEVSFIGFAKKTITGIEVTAGEATVLNIVLQSKTTKLNKIVVTATQGQNSSAGLLSIQKKAVSLQDGLSSQYIEKTGASDVASAVKHIPGVTLVNDNEVFIRGLGSRYSSVQLNGASLPSTSPTKEKSPIDIIGAGLVDHVVVKKTYTPDQPAEFAGGTVKISTKEFPHEQHFGISYSTSISSVSAFQNTLSYTGSNLDFLGYDNGLRSLPDVLKADRLSENNETAAVKNIPNIWQINDSSPVLPSQKITLSYADQYNQDAMPIGLVSSFTYKYNRNLKANKLLRTTRAYVQKSDQFLMRSDYTADVGIEKAKVGGMLNLYAKPSSVTKIGWKNMYSNALTNSTHIIKGSYFNYPRLTRQTILDFDRRSVFSSTLFFETFFNRFYNSRLTVSGTFSRASRQRPDRRTTQYNLSRQGEFKIYFDDAGNSHYYSSQLDNNYTAKIDYTIEPASFLTVKTGLSGVLKNRDFEARKLEYRNFGNEFPDDLRDAPPMLALDSELVINDLLDLRETSSPQDSYTGTQQLYAAYLSTVWRPADDLMIEVGARIENSDMEVKIADEDQTTQIANVENVDILPAVNASYSLTENIKLRGAFSITLSRPNFREISDYRFQNFIGGQTIYGNPNLEQTQIYNYDLRLETYPNPGELFAVSLFYKKFDNPVALFYRFTEAVEVQYKNADKATLYGVEVVARKYITPNFQVVANASYIYSEAVVKEEDRYAVANPSRSMYGQSPYIVNLGLYYAVPTTAIDLSLNYHTFGKRLIRVGKRAQQFDEYEQPFHSLNFGISYRYGPATFSAGVENILGDDIVYKQGDLATFRYEPGRTYEVGISLSF